MENCEIEKIGLRGEGRSADCSGAAGLFSAETMALVLVVIYALWVAFIAAEWLWFHLTGHPFWPVVS